jgi:Carboxypeptidase regulatory-like domain/Calx-beta domain
MIVTVVRTGNIAGTSTVDFETVFSSTRNELGAVNATPGPACTGNTDYIPQSGTLTFLPMETVQSFSVTICGDAATETIEGFPLVLSNPVNASFGMNTPILATINDAASQFVNSDLLGVPISGDASGTDIVVTTSATTINTIRVTLFDVSHISASALDVLLVGPQGQKFILMADAGGPTGLDDPVTLTFSDAAGQVVPQNSIIETGSYEPTSWEPGQTSFTSPAPAGPYTEPGSTVGGPVTLASVFDGTNPNGTWSLYVRDDLGAFQPMGINGQLQGGWGIQFVVPTAAGVSVEGRVRSGKNGIANATVSISGGDLEEAMTVRTNQFGRYQFEGLTAGQTYVVTVNSRR